MLEAESRFSFRKGARFLTTEALSLFVAWLALQGQPAAGRDPDVHDAEPRVRCSSSSGAAAAEASAGRCTVAARAAHCGISAVRQPQRRGFRRLQLDCGTGVAQGALSRGLL